MCPEKNRQLITARLKGALAPVASLDSGPAEVHPGFHLGGALALVASPLNTGLTESITGFKVTDGLKITNQGL